MIDEFNSSIEEAGLIIGFSIMNLFARPIGGGLKGRLYGIFAIIS